MNDQVMKHETCMLMYVHNWISICNMLVSPSQGSCHCKTGYKLWKTWLNHFREANIFVLIGTSFKFCCHFFVSSFTFGLLWVSKDPHLTICQILMTSFACVLVVDYLSSLFWLCFHAWVRVIAFLVAFLRQGWLFCNWFST